VSTVAHPHIEITEAIITAKSFVLFVMGAYIGSVLRFYVKEIY
jgi:hypothetical protein